MKSRIILDILMTTTLYIYIYIYIYICQHLYNVLVMERMDIKNVGGSRKTIWSMTDNNHFNLNKW